MFKRYIHLNTPSIYSTNSLLRYSLIVPSIHPDELIHGYVGRLATLNALKGSDFTKRKLIRIGSLKADLSSSISIGDIVSEITNRPKKYLLRHHTLNHILQGRRALDKPISANNLELISNVFPKQGIYFCRLCSTEDIKLHGFSYWRVSHQMHGLEFCLKHKIGLFIAAKKFAFDSMPHLVDISAGVRRSKHINQHTQNETILKYFELCKFYQNNETILDIDSLTTHLRKLANNLEIKLTRRGGDKHLGDYIMSLVPNSWIFDHFEALSPWSANGLSDMRSCLTRQTKKYNIYNYLLTIAALDPKINIKKYTL